MMTLFQRGNFTLHSGAKSAWKIECDALTADDWAGLAAMAVPMLPPFGSVVGIPRGGLPFAAAMEPYIWRTLAGEPNGPRLVVDDVWTTGQSMEVAMSGDDIGCVVFSRGITTAGVLALFQMPHPDVQAGVLAHTLQKRAEMRRSAL